MKLIELEPHFVRYKTTIEPRQFIVGEASTWRDRGSPTEERIVPVQSKHYVDSFEIAQGIIFLCPKCFETNKGRIGTHQVEVTFKDRGATDDQGTQNEEGPVRWDACGSSYDTLTILPSILLIGGCDWHGYITNGEIK